MPRSNRPRGRHREPDNEGNDLARLLSGWKRTEQRRTGLWNVQPVAAAQAGKVYVCPGCGGNILAQTAHVVTWRADGLMGDENDLAARRHWHLHCWRMS